MTPDQWQRIKETFEAALAEAPADRAGFLQSSCSQGTVIRSEVERLLAEQERAPGFLDAASAGPERFALSDSQIISTESPLIGQNISHYQILAKLGEGGMGIVYRAFDTKLRRTVAMKVLSPGRIGNADDDSNTRLIREARAASALNHPNVAHVYEIGETDELKFIVMEYVEGRTLRDMLKESRFDHGQVIDIASQIAEGLAEAHAHGVVHRDVKPGNIMLNSKGRVKILDFGLAKLSRSNLHIAGSGEDSLSMPGALIGTLRYMAPEQVLGRSADQRSDIFSLGAVLYEMAAGRPLFEGATATETMDHILSAESLSLSQLGSRFGAEFKRILRKCLAKQPEDRYQTAGELARDLKLLKPPAALGQLLRQTLYTRRRAIGIAAAVCGILLTGITMYRVLPMAGGIHSIAILPFENIGGDDETEYLSDGITDSLISTFSRMPSLRVIARDTMFTFKGKTVEPKQVGRELQVQAVVSGQVRQRDNSLELRAKLVDATNASQLWAGSYTGTVSDLLMMRQAVENEILKVLRIVLTQTEQDRIARRTADDAEAYRLYLKGRYALLRATVPDPNKAIGLFSEAIEVQPNYALAYSGLSVAYSILSSWRLAPREVMPKAKAAAARALEIDPALPEAHFDMAIVSATYEYDWLRAEREIRQSIALDPNDALFHMVYGLLLTVNRRFQEGIAETKKAQQLDPLSSYLETRSLMQQYHRGPSKDETVVAWRKFLEFNPDSFSGHVYLGLAYLARRMYPEAVSEFESSDRIAAQTGSQLPRALLGCAFALSGRTEEAWTALDQLQTLRGQRYVSGYFLAVLYAALGAKDDALAWLQTAYEDRDDELVSLAVDPLLDSLRADPRFIALLRRVGVGS